MSINWEHSKEDTEKIFKIVTRSVELRLSCADDTLELAMSITAAHCNGCRLDLDKLLSADDFNFTHDVCGIYRHVSRETGELENHFRPRCAAK